MILDVFLIKEEFKFVVGNFKNALLDPEYHKLSHFNVQFLAAVTIFNF